MYVRHPYLIQRGTIQRPLASEDTRLSKAVSLDYMGSAEFEFGALPRSFRAIEQSADAWKYRKVPEIMSGEHQLRVYSFFDDEAFEEYKRHLLDLRAGKTRTKESTYFQHDHPQHYRSLTCDFWWDIDNHTMFGFDKVFMNKLPHYVAASLKYMNEAK